MRCTSLEGPSVATVRACVSPRVKRPEPWARGSRPTSTEMGRMVSASRPSMRMPSARTISRDGLLVEVGWCSALDRPAASRAASKAASAAAPSPPPLRRRMDVGDALLEGVDARGQVRRQPQEQGRRGLGVGQGAVLGRDRQLEELDEVGQLVDVEVRDRRRGPGRACRGSGRARCGCRRRGRPRGRRCRSRRCGPRGCRRRPRS